MKPFIQFQGCLSQTTALTILTFAHLFLTAHGLIDAEDDGKTIKYLELDKDYRIYQRKLNWKEALEYCTKCVGQFATFETPDDANKVKDLVYKISFFNEAYDTMKEDNEWGLDRRYWFGLSDEKKEGKWMWVSTPKNDGKEVKDVETYRWYTNQPDHIESKTSEHCGGFWNPVFHLDTKKAGKDREESHYFNDFPCDLKMYFICKTGEAEKPKDDDCKSEETKAGESSGTGEVSETITEGEESATTEGSENATGEDTTETTPEEESGSTTPDEGSETTTTIGEGPTTEISETTAMEGETTAEGMETTTGDSESTTPGEETTIEGMETTTGGSESTTPGEETTIEGMETTTGGSESTTPGEETTAEGMETTTGESESTTPGEETTTKAPAKGRAMTIQRPTKRIAKIKKIHPLIKGRGMNKHSSQTKLTTTTPNPKKITTESQKSRSISRKKLSTQTPSTELLSNLAKNHKKSKSKMIKALKTSKLKKFLQSGNLTSVKKLKPKRKLTSDELQDALNQVLSMEMDEYDESRLNET